MDLGRAPEAGTVALILFTALVGVLMGVFGKAAAEWLLNLILRPVRFLTDKVYGWIAPRNPFSIALRSYKRHLSRSHLTTIENPVGPVLDVPLEHAFAPLKLISSRTEESVELFAQAAASHRCIVLGGPGTGKTTLMKSLVTSVVKGRTREEALKDLIPVFVVLRDLAKREHTVEQSIVAAFAQFHFPGADKFVASALEQGKMLVILDGLDEVGASRDFVAEKIREFCEYDTQRQQRNRLIVTCREHSYRTKDLRGVIDEEVRVEPFANHHMRVFLHGWPAHKGRTAMKLYGLIQDDPQIRDICRNPLLLTILTGLYLDTDDFELPSSRENFYKDAVDELLVQRPKRRNVKQAFDPDDKRQILERVALDRLETAERHEDPEEFTHEVIRRKAEEVLRQEKFDPRELIKELVELNGIIKPADEGSYTCAHRTIQEYFAAREAKRRRKPEEVVEHFGGRPEFIEVLYFYCGLMDNVPSLAYVLNTLTEQERWLEAGRCILYMKEPPDETTVETVARKLHDQVAPSVEYKSALEVLSSLAQRRAPEFDPARKHFARAIDRLAEGHTESGASALESVLSTSPEAAMKLIPALLKHHSPRWKKAAIQLLRDIGTDEALDQLVLLLKDPDPEVRANAARKLVGMIKTRHRDLVARATLLPERKDPLIWPLEELFPGSIAIPIAEALTAGSFAAAENRAIDHATWALHARLGTGGESVGGQRILEAWSRVMRDHKFRRYRRRAGAVVAQVAYVLSLVCVLAVTTLQILAYKTANVVTVTLSPPQVNSSNGDSLRLFRSQAQTILKDIEAHHPSNASGWSRILPWNWNVEPALPDGDDKTLEAMYRLSEHNFDPYSLSDDSIYLLFLRGRVADREVDKMETYTDSLRASLPDVHGRRYMAFVPTRGFLTFLFFAVFLILMSLFISHFWREAGIPRYALVGASATGGRALRLVVLASLMLIIPLIWSGSLLLRLLPSLVLTCNIAGLILKQINWPRNDHLDAVGAITPEVGKSLAAPAEVKGDDGRDNRAGDSFDEQSDKISLRW